MKSKIITILLLSIIVSGCETTNSIPYKASIANVISIQQSLQSQGKKVSVGDFSAAQGVNSSPMCRLMGPVTVAPGKSLEQFIKDAFQEELFMAQAYQASSTNIIEGRIETLSFSSVSPASWEISMNVKSNNYAGYTTSIKYPFDTSYSAYSACKNVADAFGPAVQELIKQVVNNQQFSLLAK